MKTLASALFSSSHISTVITALCVVVLVIVGDVLGWLNPDYQRMLVAMILIYGVTVLIEWALASYRKSQGHLL